MKNVVIVDSVRTGLSKSFRGSFNMTRGDDMITHLIDAILDRNPNLPADAVEATFFQWNVWSADTWTNKEIGAVS